MERQEQAYDFSGFGGADRAPGYLRSPARVEDVAALMDEARTSGRQIVLRGSGRSYGDAAIGDGCLILDGTGFNRVLEFDPECGLLQAEPGVTIEDLWRTALPLGWWPPVVSGTMFPTLGGALAMNIHGKNAFRAGPLGEHVTEIEVLFPNGGLRRLTPEDDLFYAVISSAGLLGAIVRVTVQLKRVSSGMLKVYASSCRNWAEQFDRFDRHRAEADYMVAWIDAFGHGRGLFHAANHDAEDDPASLQPACQDLPARAMGILPKSQVWRMLRWLNRRSAMRLLNKAKHVSGRTIGNEKTHRQSLVAFSFLLDYVPGWERAYQPDGFIQYQAFVPEASAPSVFAEMMARQRAERQESFLSVMKRHRPDRFLFSHGVEGYSLAMDFKVRRAEWSRLEELCHQMNDLVLGAQGRFYFAKDSILRPEDVRAAWGEETLNRFRVLKAELDPGNLLTSALAKRVGLDPA